MLLSASSFAVQNRHLLTSLRAASPRDTRNAAPQYLACGSQSVARHIRAQTRRSLNECALVRLASQAVQPSQNIVAYRPWSGRYAPCFSPTSPRFIRHRRRFGDVARSSKKSIKHCGAAIVSLIISVSRVARFCFAIIQVFRKFQFANDIFETILSKFASIAFLLLFFNCIELILTQEYN